MRYIFLFAALCCCSVEAQPVLKVSESAWRGLSAGERAVIQQKYLVETVGSESFGVIIDNQGADRSTSGTNSGAALGGAIANAVYVDKAIGNGNYSAKNQLGAILLGGLLGSALDSKPQSQYQFRYAIRLGNGAVIYQDAFSSEPFRHPVGVCVFLPAISIAPEQHLCAQTTDSLRGAYIQNPQPDVSQSVESPIRPVQATLFDTRSGAESTELIYCKLGALAPVKTSLEKCKTINGVILND